MNSVAVVRLTDMTTTVKGAASYFPSIEKRYGKPIEAWKAIIYASGLTTWKELVALLKTDYRCPTVSRS